MNEIIKNDISDLHIEDFGDTLFEKSILITGATGLLGTYLSSALALKKKIGLGPRKIVVTSKSSNFQKGVPYIEMLDMINGDIADPTFIKSLSKFDVIIHAAGYGQPGKFLDQPLQTLALNSSSLIQLIDHLNNGGKFLFISSSEVYSGRLDVPFTENFLGTTNTDHPRAPYIEGKRCGEAIITTASKQLNFSGYIARLALAYGPGTRPGDTRVVNQLIFRALTEHKINLIDSGEAMRTYCYISDAVSMILRILDSNFPGIYNVGGVSRISIKDLAESIAAIIGVRVTVPPVSLELPGAPNDVWLDLNKTLSIVPNQNFLDLNSGLRRTIDWQRYIYNL